MPLSLSHAVVANPNVVVSGKCRICEGIYSAVVPQSVQSTTLSHRCLKGEWVTLEAKR